MRFLDQITQKAAGMSADQLNGLADRLQQEARGRSIFVELNAAITARHLRRLAKEADQ